MKSTVDEVAPGIHRLSTFIPEVGPVGLTFNQYLIEADQPLLFQTGMRSLFPVVRSLVEQVMPVERLRWISFSHVEADECGALDEFMAAAPDAQVLHSDLGIALSVGDMAPRPPVGLADGASLDLGGGRSVRMIETPHVPHNWESIVLFEEGTSTLLCGDLLSQAGEAPPVRGDEVLPIAVESEQGLGQLSMGPQLGPTLHRLADLRPATLGIMHGSAHVGDGAAVLRGFADALTPAAVPA